MAKNIKKLGFGLKPLPKDTRDFSLGAVFGRISIWEVPNTDFEVAIPLEIKDQKDLDFCTGYALSAVSEDQEGVILDPLFTFAKIKQIIGNWQDWGADLRDACKEAIQFGSIEEKDSPYTLRESRDFLANWENWPKELDEKAQKHRKQSFFTVDGYADIFDAIRASIWQHRAEKRSILTGALWEDKWTYAPGGIIPKEVGVPVGGHAFKIFGQKIIDNVPYLKAQLSNNEDIGDKGIFYFSRETVNLKFIFGNFMFKDMDPEEVKKIVWPLWRRIWEKIKKSIKEYFNILLK